MSFIRPMLWGHDATQTTEYDLFMLDSNLDRIVRVDVATGLGVTFGALRWGIGETAPYGIEYDSARNVLFAVGRTLDALVRVHPVTGQGEIVDDQVQLFGVEEHNPFGLSIHPVTRELYMVGLSQGALFTVDKDTGIATAVGAASSFGIGETSPTSLAIDPNPPHTAYFAGFQSDALSTIDLTTGTATIVDETVLNYGVGIGGVTGLAFHPTTGVLYCSDNSTDALYTMDPSTGIATRVNANAIRFGVVAQFPRDLTFIRRNP